MSQIFRTMGALSDWLFPALPFVLGYAEIHYTFKGVYSFLKHPFPEILADAPYRLEPGVPLPITVLVKDAHRYPIRLKKITAIGTVENAPLVRARLFSGDLLLSSPWWSRTYLLSLPEKTFGQLKLTVRFEIERKGKLFRFENDNYRGTGHAPLQVHVSSHPLPRFPGLVYGDLHTHSNFTSDQVEFGAPLSDLRAAATALGLDFVAVTDHSYDLDDYENNYLKNDPKLRKWARFRREVNRFNTEAKSGETLLIPGEEVTVRNARGRNVHFLVLNSARFFKGSGDGAEKWFKFHSEHSIRDVLDALPPEAVAIAAHPGTPPPRLEYLLVHRGKWEEKDTAHSKLQGLQIVNGDWGRGFQIGLHLWKRALARGERKFIFAGTDAHGNFNRYRQIGFPFFKMIEMNEQILGEKRTGLFVKARSLPEILEAIRSGRGFVTDGPALQFEAENALGQRVPLGGRIFGRDIWLKAQFVSTPEFGKLTTIRLFRGKIGEGTGRVREKLLQVQTEGSDGFAQTFSRRFALEAGEHVYFRLEMATDKGRRAYSNPIWVFG